MIFPFDIKDINELYNNSESGNGGFFPLGKGVLWHSGIHINCNKKEKFSPILNGKVILYRLSKDYKKVSLPEIISRDRYFSNENYYKDLYTISKETSEEYQIIDKNLMEYVSDCFIMLKHELNIDALNPKKFIFYTIYANLEPDSDSIIYKDTKFQTDGLTHFLNDKESFSTNIIGVPGLDKKQRYFDYVLILDKDLNSFTYDKSKSKDLFLGIKSGTTIYGRQLTNSLQSIPYEELFIPKHTSFEICEYSKDGENLAKFVSLKSFRVYLQTSGGLKGTNFIAEKKYEINDCSKIWFSTGEFIDFSKEKNTLPKTQQFLYDILKHPLQSLKGTSVTVVNVTNKGQPAINVYLKNEKKFWIINDDGSFAQNDGIIKKEQLSIKAYSMNPYIYNFSPISVSDEFRKSITYVENDIYKAANNKIYFKAIGNSSNYFIDENTKNDCFKNCYDWKEWFFNYKPSDENSLQSENTSLTQNLIDWYEERRKKYGWLSIVLSPWWETLSYLTWKFLKLIYDGKKDVQASEQMPIEYRKCICKHPIEWNFSIIEKLSNAKQAKETDQKTVKSEFFTYLKDVAKATDIWETGLSKIFPSNSLFFANPIYFINHFERCGVFEFNPYSELTYEGVKVKNTPGFAPYLGETQGINGYSQMTWEFNGTTTANGGTTYHAGLDFAIDFHKCGTIPIHSLIQGKVIAAIDYGNENFGNCIVVQSSLNPTYYYIVAHMDRTKDSLKDGDSVYPGKTVGYVGNTGKQFTSWYRTEDGKDEQRSIQLINESDRKYGYGSHLHLQFIKSEKSIIGNGKNGKYLITPVNPSSYNPIDYSEKWKG